MEGLSSHNPLIVILGLVTAAGVAGIAYLAYVALGRETREIRRGFGALFTLIGVFAVGGFVQLIWSDWAGFPAEHYTELFGVTTGLFSFLMVSAGVLMLAGYDLKPLSWPSALIGLMLLQGARAVLAFDLTRNPAMTFLIWLFAGIAGVGMVPFAYAPEGSRARRYLAVAGIVALLIMTIGAFVTGFNGFYGHIARVVEQKGG